MWKAKYYGSFNDSLDVTTFNVSGVAVAVRASIPTLSGAMLRNSPNCKNAT